MWTTRRSILGILSGSALYAQRPLRGRYEIHGTAGMVEAGAEEMRGLVERFSADQRSLDLFYPLPFSADRIAAMEEFGKAWRGAIEEVPFAKLGVEGRIDWLLLRNRVEVGLTELGEDARHWREMQSLVAFAPGLWKLEETRQRVDPVEGSDAAAALVNALKQVEELSGWLKKGGEGKPGASIALRASKLVEEMGARLKRWYGFYEGYDPVFQWWVKDPYEKLAKGLVEYGAVLREKAVGLKKEDKDTIIGDPVGRAAIEQQLRAEMIAYSPEELIAIAEREFAWCDAEMLKASRELGKGEDWKAALEHVKGLHAGPGGQPKMIVELATEAIDFVTKKDLVTVPQLARDTWRMEMMTPERQRVNPFFLGGEMIIVSFPTDGMTHEQKMMSMRGNNEHFARATVHHELIPGHFLQRFSQARSRRYRGQFSTPFWIEGWALYWEMLLWDLGFARNAADRVGMLFWRMHRCARIVFSLRFHLGLMTAQQCVDYLVDRVGHERENAAGEVRRSFETSYAPLYQAAYMLGGLQIRGLHRDLVQSGKLTNRAFHDRILQGNSMPIEMVRASLMGTKLEKDFVAKWRF